LLDRSRGELQNFAQAEKIVHREDQSNAQLDYRRNRIRRELLPRLQHEYQSALREIVLRQMEILGAEHEVIGQLAQDWLEGKRAQTFAHLPVAVQRECLQRELIRCGIDPRFELIETLRKFPDQAVTAAAGLTVKREASGGLRLEHLPARRDSFGDKPGPRAADSNGPSGAAEGIQVELALPQGQLQYDGLRIDWTVQPHHGEIPVQGLPGIERFDADKVGRSISLRHWRAGDRFQPSGMPWPVKLQDCFTNLKVPRSERHRRVIALAASGELFWVQGLRLAERFKLDKGTVNCLIWRWQTIAGDEPTW
jgi:tRNA(Ile)-lysidine synthase